MLLTEMGKTEGAGFEGELEVSVSVLAILTLKCPLHTYLKISSEEGQSEDNDLGIMGI